MITLRSSLKNETSTSKKTIREMEASLTECTARTQKAEREYAVLRDSIKGLVESFQTDAVNLREEMKRREEKLKSEAEEMGRKYRLLLEQIQKEREEGGEGIGELRRLTKENERIGKEIEDGLRTEMRSLRAEVDRSTKESEEATQTAKWVHVRLCICLLGADLTCLCRDLAAELGRLRRLMRQAGAAAAQDARNGPS